MLVQNKICGMNFVTIASQIGQWHFFSFGKDKWLGETPLREEFPCMHLVATPPDLSIAQNRSGSTWDLRFRRNMQDWEMIIA